jgi:CRP-like cAMP-binding protein
MALISPKGAPGARQTIRVYEVWSTIESLAASHELGSLVAVRVWSLLWLFRDPQSGVVGLTREDIASTIGLTPRRVSRILTALRSRQLITTRLQRVPRARGPGQVIITVPAPE